MKQAKHPETDWNKVNIWVIRLVAVVFGGLVVAFFASILIQAIRLIWQEGIGGF